jgi:hypothetical protein
MIPQRARYMTLENVGQLSDDHPSACPSWRDQPGSADKHDDRCRQIHHFVEQDLSVNDCVFVGGL